MAQGLPTSLARPIVHSIDYVEAVTAVRMEVTSDVPTLARFGFRGGIGVARGQAPFMVTLTFAGTAEKTSLSYWPNSSRSVTAMGSPGILGG